MGSMGTAVTLGPPSYEVIVQESSNELPPPSYAEAIALLHRTIENGKHLCVCGTSITTCDPLELQMKSYKLFPSALDAKSSSTAVSCGSITTAENIRRKP